MMRTRTEPRTLDRTLTALADPTRRGILERLARGEARVTELAAEFPISLNSVSKHIRRLERARLVRRRVMGRNHYIRIWSEPLRVLQDWIVTTTAFWQGHLQALDEELGREARRARRSEDG